MKPTELATLCARWHHQNALEPRHAPEDELAAWTDAIDALETEIAERESADGAELVAKLSVFEERLEQDGAMSDADDLLLRSVIADAYRLLGPR